MGIWLSPLFGLKGSDVCDEELYLLSVVSNLQYMCVCAGGSFPLQEENGERDRQIDRQTEADGVLGAGVRWVKWGMVDA